jgi:glycolate oxidase iron-sulfur subunit
MQTRVVDQYRQWPGSEQAEEIIRHCVHCGFCNATCPTYQLTGNELDGPRGRIYQIKQILEGQPVTPSAYLHLDRCLECRNCETTCPSGVDYGTLLPFGKRLVATQQGKASRLGKWLLTQLLAYPRRLGPFLRLGQWLRPFMPTVIQKKIPARLRLPTQTLAVHARKMLLLDGCVQNLMTPATNVHLRNVFDRLGISLEAATGCCAGLHQHLGQEAAAQQQMKDNIDHWLGLLDQGYERLVSSASGCGITIRHYPEYLANDADYLDKAKRLAAHTDDVSEVLRREDLSVLKKDRGSQRVAFHPPCTLQHGLKLNGVVEEILTAAGYRLQPIRDVHLCCGSAGPYSLFHPRISAQLAENKWQDIGAVDLLVTANVGCELHLSAHSSIAVKHWISCL